MADNDKTDEIREQVSDETVGADVDTDDGAVLTLDDGEVEGKGDEASDATSDSTAGSTE